MKISNGWEGIDIRDEENGGFNLVGVVCSGFNLLGSCFRSFYFHNLIQKQKNKIVKDGLISHFAKG